MNLWHKVFLCTFILFEILFNASSFYLIEHNFNQNLKNEVARGLSEQLIVQSQIQTDWTYVSSLNQQLGMTDNSQNFLKNNTQKYTRYFDGSQVFIEILDDQDNSVFSNFTVEFNEKKRSSTSLTPVKDSISSAISAVRPIYLSAVVWGWIMLPISSAISATFRTSTARKPRKSVFSSK